MHTILLVGAAQILLDTRAAVLRTIGAEVLSSPAESAIALQAKRECDLIVLCHSLKADVSEAIVTTVRTRWPGTRLIQIVPGRSWAQSIENGAVDAVSSAQPERLIALTSQLLRLPSDSPAFKKATAPPRPLDLAS